MAGKLVYFMAGVGTAALGYSVYFFNYLKKQNDEERARFANIKELLLKSRARPVQPAPVVPKALGVSQTPPPAALPKPVTEKKPTIPKPQVVAKTVPATTVSSTKELPKVQQKETPKEPVKEQQKPAPAPKEPAKEVEKAVPAPGVKDIPKDAPKIELGKAAKH